MNLRRTIPVLALAAGLAIGGCGGRHAAPVFVGGPVVEAVDDTAPIPRPAEAEFNRMSHHLDNFYLRQARLGLDPTPAEPALDVNRLGRVPDSSWYENRLGRLSPRQVAQGPGGDDPGPEAFLPWEVTGLKVGGRNPGFNFRDSRGARYICKFDKPDAPVIATAAGAVAARLLWAAGYNVPDDRVVHFDPDALLIAEDATARDAAGRKRPLTRDDIDALLAALPQARHGDGCRALVSRFLDGRPIGGFAYAGTRPDDPNDRIPHERRRSLRGLRVFGAWLQHVDLKVDNTLDLYVGEDGAGHVRHYLVDFDGCLGGYWAARREPRIGYAHDVDLGTILSGIPTLGLVVRPWEGLDAPVHPQVGLFTEEAYDPADWAPNYVNDYLHACGPADAFWAGTVLARITDDMIDAAVTAGRYPDPAAAAELARVLKARRDATVDWALGCVSPVTNLANVTLGPDRFWIAAREHPGRPSFSGDLEWSLAVTDAAGRHLPTVSSAPVFPTVTLRPDDLASESYLRIVWTAREVGSGRRLPPTEAHYRRDGDGWRLIGVLRAGE